MIFQHNQLLLAVLADVHNQIVYAVLLERIYDRANAFEDASRPLFEQQAQLIVIHLPSLRRILRKRGDVIDGEADHRVLAAFLRGAEADGVVAERFEFHDEREFARGHIHFQTVFQIIAVHLDHRARFAGAADHHRIGRTLLRNGVVQLDFNIVCLTVDHDILSGFLVMGRAHDHRIGVIADGAHAYLYAQIAAAIHLRG